MRSRLLVMLLSFALLGTGAAMRSSILEPPRPVSVYVFDSGISATHPELRGRVHMGFIGYPEDTVSCNGHGTAVASAIAGKTLGVNPNAVVFDIRIIKCKTLKGNMAVLSRGADAAIEHYRRHGKGSAVANLSIFVDTTFRVAWVDTIVKRLRDAGMIVVAAGGNFNMNACRISPANSPGVIAVGSLTFMGSGNYGIASRTAWGPCIDFYAPGDNVLLAKTGNSKVLQESRSGTSMSTGYISGAVSEFLESAPGADEEDVREYLKSIATRDFVSSKRFAKSYLLHLGVMIGSDFKMPRSLTGN
ncbi:S8 family serine peptidase [Candidatus Parcubacteria bacterium]|nr:S8 family serine peptidase [Candidatus Parcubacteria bacterium]